ncbi:4-hydroxybenzoate octaprenyltransferase [Acetobacter sp. AN02]|uniref:4-hydroxybenzoate octaprenyltransferase n=1 Tax=Acetobacter sp. AN02 TaxID=2894186 RepID=UPI0024343D43|nr:4-hydroxybenzoate octaprenyltransferase [Acetobacter sp. AN02]MDG6095463.1 4-hydroxybenzoate octaprenyltransferase [Acetobacter sp. AN02]
MSASRAPHTDIVTDGWIARLPPAVRPYALLARLDRPVGTWLLFLPGVWGILLPSGATAPERIRLLLLFGLGSLIMRSAGCVVNDMWDRDIDRQVTRTAGRPLAAGVIRMRHAGYFLIGLLLSGLLILLQLNPAAQILGALSLILVALYPLAKRFTWWPQLVMGFTFGFGAPLGYVAATGRIDAAMIALYAGTIMWQLGFDTIYGFQDMEDDARIGVKSTSRLMAGRAVPFILVCYVSAIALLITAGLLAEAGKAFLPVLIIPAFMLIRQALTVKTDDPALCLRQFRLNREIGLLIGLSCLAGLCS